MRCTLRDKSIRLGTEPSVRSERTYALFSSPPASRVPCLTGPQQRADASLAGVLLQTHSSFYNSTCQTSIHCYLSRAVIMS